MAKEVNKDKKNKKEKNNFFKEFKAELKRVSWPTSKQLVNNTLAVISIVVIFAVVVFILDLGFEWLNQIGVERLKKLVTSSSVESEQTEENTENSDNSNTTDEISNNVDAEVVEDTNQVSSEATSEQTTTDETANTVTSEESTVNETSTDGEVTNTNENGNSVENVQ